MRDGDISDRQISGSGLGLAIARGIVEAHHGRIWVEDADHGSGAKFMIELPISESSQCSGRTVRHVRGAMTGRS